MSTPTKYKITASYNFIRIFQNLDSKKSPTKYPSEQPDAIKVVNFISEYLHNGWHVNLKGKNVSSENVPYGTPNWHQKVRYAQKHKLHHYHIGIPTYILSSNGYLVPVRKHFFALPNGRTGAMPH